MLKQRREAAENLANRLFETEAAIDEAIRKMAELTGYMPVARETANLSAVIGQDALTNAAQALSSLIIARGQIVDTHNSLAETRDQIGLRTMAMGGGFDKPPRKASASANVRLVEVTNAA